LYKSLELVPLFFGFLGGVEKINGERLSPDRQCTVGAVEMVYDAYHDYEEGYRGRRNSKIFADERQ
jgi:hypothetical protein